MKKLKILSCILIIFSLNIETLFAHEVIYFIANSIIKKRNIDEYKKQEKFIIIKGLYIGMNGNEAKSKLEKNLGKDWKVTEIGLSKKILADLRTCDADVFPNISISSNGFENIPSNKNYKYPGENGFAIINKNDSYSGFVSIDLKSGKVVRLSLNGMITNNIFSSTDVTGQEFYEQFIRAYNLPEMYWIPRGWEYPSPMGYTVTLKTNKFIDIKYDPIEEDPSVPIKSGPKIKFDE